MKKVEINYLDVSEKYKPIYEILKVESDLKNSTNKKRPLKRSFKLCYYALLSFKVNFDFFLAAVFL